MLRRRFLKMLAGSALVAAASPVEGSSGKRGKLRRVETSDLGVTLFFALQNAPFPYPGKPYTDDTVAVFVPAAYRAPRGGLLDVVVHFHGHNGTVASTLAGMHLREQFVAGRQNAALILPQGPVNAADGNPGKLGVAGGLERLLAEVRHELQSADARAALGASAVSPSARIGSVILSAHSGGYRPAACSVSKGGFEVREVYLFDALYGERQAFREWVLAGKAATRGGRHKLISTYTAGGGTLEENRALQAELQQNGVRVLHHEEPGALTPAQLAHGNAIFVRTSVAHGDAIWKDDALSTCLSASCLAHVAGSDTSS